jgi:hypothetical protein
LIRGVLALSLFPCLDAFCRQLVGFVQMETHMSFNKHKLLTVMMPFALLLLAAPKRSALQGSSEPSGIGSLESNGNGPEQARSAYDFVNSIGVNTHLNYFDRTYGNFDLVKLSLRSIGIRHLRDGIHLQGSDYNKLLYGRWTQLGESGIRFDAVLDPRSRLGELMPAMLARVDEMSGHSIESFEGPNELDISGNPQWLAVDQNYQKAIFVTVKALSDANHFKVIGPSLAIAANGAVLDGPLDGLNEGNLHPYPAGKMPSAVFPEQTELAEHIFGDKPIVFTETGYHNALNDHKDQPGVSEEAAAKYIPRLFLENFGRGIARTYLYELMDEAPDPGLSDNQMHWGLTRADGTEKPAFVALKRLIEVLNDNAEPATLMQLSWSLSKSDRSIHHLLLQKSNGEFDLVLWREIPSYDVRRQADIVNLPVEASLTLGRTAKSVQVYEPVLQAGTMASYTNTKSVSVAIPDHPLVVAITQK